ncbi:MAG: hypothetical protein M9918_17425 [Anaerolineae bacterium]|nr:hypothetical protein [Anaerolineae bacterium]
MDVETVRRLRKRLGRHGHQYHDEHVVDVDIKELQADKRHGFAGKRCNHAWEAEMIAPESKFVLTHVQGRREEELIAALYQDTVKRVRDKHSVALFTDGFGSYKSLFPVYFGRPYHPPYSGRRRPHNIRYRIPRQAAHVQVVKHRQGRQLHHVEIRYAHGSQRRINQALQKLGYCVPNTSAIERRNGTARLMSPAQQRKSLAFAKRDDGKVHSGWWALTVYNWCRPRRSLRIKLAAPQGKKSLLNARRRWRLGWQIPFLLSLRSSVLRSFLSTGGDNLTSQPIVLQKRMQHLSGQNTH